MRLENRYLITGVPPYTLPGIRVSTEPLGEVVSTEVYPIFSIAAGFTRVGLLTFTWC